MNLKNIELEARVVAKVLRIFCDIAKSEEQKAEGVADLFLSVDKKGRTDLVLFYLLCCCSDDESNAEAKCKINAEVKTVSLALSSKWGKNLKRNIMFSAQTSGTVEDAMELTDLILSSIDKAPKIVDCEVAALLLASFSLKKYDTVFM